MLPVLALCLALLLAAGLAGAGAAWWVLSRYTLSLPLRSQPLQVRLPDTLPVEVEILPQPVDGNAPTQTLPVRIDDTFRTTVRVDTRVPIRMQVPFRAEVPVDITLPVKTRVRTRLLGVAMELPIEAEIPLRFSLPVSLDIPIDQSVPMKLDLPVSTRINQIVNVQVQTQQTARILLRQPVLEVVLDDGEISVPLSWLSLLGPQKNGAPSRLGPISLPPHEETPSAANPVSRHEGD